MFREKVGVGDLVVIKSGRIGIIKRIWKQGLFKTYYDIIMLDSICYKVLKRKEFEKYVTNK